MTIPFHQLAAIAYLPEIPVRQQLEKFTEWHDPEFYDNDGTQAFVASSDDDDLIAVFRGTEAIGDWLKNIDTTMVDNQQGGGRIHRGFAQALEAVWGRMHSEITRRNPLRVFLIGHSLGGAVATLAAGSLAYHGRGGIHLSTYGSPRVGNGKFVRWLLPHLDGHNRFVNCADAVTRVPHLAWGCRPPFINGIYRHVGQPHYINSNGRVIDSPPPGYITLDRLWYHRKHPFQFFRSPVGHHSIWTEYAVHLEGQ